MIAKELGFSQLRIAPAVEATGFSDLQRWIEAGYAGEMHYFKKRLDAYRHPAGVLAGVRVIIVLTLPYPALGTPSGAPVSAHSDTENPRGRTARYTWLDEDYHDIIHAKLKTLIGRLREWSPSANSRAVVDTAPLLEREYAELAGLGWRAKNTLLINKFAGSYFFLASLLTDLDLPIDLPHTTDHCGTCTRCLDACPTNAFPQAGVLDASRCISYLTIEHRDPIPRELRAGMGDWVFGCDVCQEVCPWNGPERLVKLNAPSTLVQPAVGSQTPSLDLHALFSLTDEDFRSRFRHTPMWRPRRRGILRNAAIVLGNRQLRQSLEPLSLGLNDPEPLIRGAAAWAIRQIGGERADKLIAARLAVETDDVVRSELQ